MADFLYDVLVIDGVHHGYLPSHLTYVRTPADLAATEVLSVNNDIIYTAIRKWWGDLDRKERVYRGRMIQVTWETFAGEPTFADQCMVDQLYALHSLQRGFYIQFDNILAREDGKVFIDDHAVHLYTPNYPIVKRGSTPYAAGDDYSLVFDVLTIPPTSLGSVEENVGEVSLISTVTGRVGYRASIPYTVRHFCVVEAIDFKVEKVFDEAGRYQYTGRVLLREVQEPDSTYIQPWPIYCGDLPKGLSTDDDDNEEIFPPPVSGFLDDCYEIAESNNSPLLPNGTLYSQVDYSYTPFADLPDNVFVRKITETIKFKMASPYNDTDAIFDFEYDRVYNDLTPVSGVKNGDDFETVHKMDKVGGYVGTAATAYNYGTKKLDFRFFTTLKFQTLTPSAIMLPGAMFDRLKATITTDIWEAQTVSGSPDFVFAKAFSRPTYLTGRANENVTYFDSSLKSEKWLVNIYDLINLSTFVNGGVGYIQKAAYVLNTSRPAYARLTPPGSGGGGGGGSPRQHPSATTAINAATMLIVGLKFEWTNPSKPIPEHIYCTPSLKYYPRQIMVAAATAYNRATGHSTEDWSIKADSQTLTLQTKREWTNTAPGVPTDPYTFNAYTLNETRVDGVVIGGALAASYTLSMDRKKVEIARSGIGYYKTSLLVTTSRVGESVQPLLDNADGMGEETLEILLTDTDGTLIPDHDYSVCIEYQKVKALELTYDTVENKDGVSYTPSTPDKDGWYSSLAKDGAYSFATTKGLRFSDIAPAPEGYQDTDWVLGLQVDFDARLLNNAPVETATMSVVFDTGGSQYVLGTIAVGTMGGVRYSVKDAFNADVISDISVASDLANLKVYLLPNTASVHTGSVLQVANVTIVAFTVDQVV